MSRDIHITRIIARTSRIALQLPSLHFSAFRPPADPWGPAINAVRFPDHLEICVDLAGVDRDHVKVSFEDRHLRIRGVRPALDAHCRECDECRVLMMEIDDGPFERVLTLPVGLAIDQTRISARQENGILWITIPTSPPV